MVALSRASFHEWARAQPRGRYERLNGEVVAMSPERWEHARLKAEIWRALDAALVGLPACRVVPHGMTVEVGEGLDFEPDVAIHCGDPIPPSSLVIPHPVVVIEVLSPSTEKVDATIKATAYLRAPSIAHYLMFRADRREVTMLSRAGGPARRFETGAAIRLDPPGITVDLDAIYVRAEAM